MGASTRENTQSPMNGEVFIRDSMVYWKGEGLEVQVVAAEHLYKLQQPMYDLHEWRLYLLDGSEAQWSMDTRKYGMQFLAETLQNMPSERPPVVAANLENQFHFGLGPLDVQEILQELEQGIGCGDIVPQTVVRSTERMQGDFEIKTVTIRYAEKKA